eukprot:6513088-Pyramimonas_sp.AAC.2
MLFRRLEESFQAAPPAVKMFRTIERTKEWSRLGLNGRLEPSLRRFQWSRVVTILRLGEVSRPRK